jgi:KaiC/GvpD/RAD55 family RecA-like ATPase
MKPSISMRRFEMLQKYPAIKSVDRNNVLRNNLRPVYFDQVDGNHKSSSANLNSPLFLQRDKKVENNIQEIIANEPNETEEIADCQLTNTQEALIQSSTSIDMFKEEWTLDELLDLNVTEIPCLVENLIPCDSLVIIAGPSDVGKSTLYTQLAIAIVKGEKEFLGFKLNPLHRRVLIVSTEDGPIPLAFRTRKQTSNEGLTRNIGKNMKIFVTSDNLEQRIINYLKDNPVDLIVIDAFSDVYQGDINASNSVRQFLNRFTKIIQKYRCSVLFVHHVCKGKKKQQSEKDLLLGSTGIVGKVRSVMMLSINNRQHQLSLVKGNYLSDVDKEKTTYLSFNPSTLTYSTIFDYQVVEETEKGNQASGLFSSSKNRLGRQKDMNLYNKAIKLDSEGMSQVKIAKIVGRDKSTVCKWLKQFKNRIPYDFSKVDEVD